MLKTLKLTSFIAVVAAVLVVGILVFLGLKGNTQVKKILESPGVLDRYTKNGGNTVEKEDIVSPLVVQARAFALRIDPPPPPAPPKPKVTPKPTPVATTRTAPPKTAPPVPKVTVAPKSDLLATVLYESSPEKSLALFKAGSTQEWFRQGDRVGNHVIKEIRDGSVILTQGGQALPEQFVPAEPSVKSLLKNEQSSTRVSQPAPAGGNDQTPSLAGGETVSMPDSIVPAPQPGRTVNTESGRTRVVRPDSSNSQSLPRQSSSTNQIRRVRTVPRQPTPTEQKESLDSTISGIEEIMNRQDDSLSEEDRKMEQELWQSLIDTLKAEQEQLDSEDKVQNSQPESDTQREEPEEKEASEEESQSNSR